MTPASFVSSVAALALAGNFAAALPSSSSPVERATTCNGDSSLCSKLYSNVTYIGTHNSYAIASGTTNLFANQERNVTRQLQDGVRLLQAQAHKSDNSSDSAIGVHLCHSSCSYLDGGAIETWLTSVKDWVASNPNEVVSLLIVNSDSVPPSTYAQAFESTGLASYMYSPASPSSSGGVAKNEWPTLSSMIDSGKRVVAYLDNSADVSAVSYLLPEFSSMWENPYDQTATPFNCSIDRSGAGETTSSQMYLVNHYLNTAVTSAISYPNTGQLFTTNSESSVLTDVNNCASMHSATYPTFVLVDYYSRPEQDVFAAAAAMNGVAYTNTSSSSTSSGSGGSSGGAAMSSFAPSGWATLMTGLAVMSMGGVLAAGMAL